MGSQRGLVQRLERKLEVTVGDAFARMFGGSIVPQEVEALLRREAADGVRSLQGNRLLAPNEYIITLGDHDFEKVNADPDLTANAFARYLADFIDEQGWQTYGEVVVRFERSSNLHTGQFRTRGAVNPDVEPRPTVNESARPQSNQAFDAEPGVAQMTDNSSYRGGQGQGRPGDDYYDDRYGRPQDDEHGGGDPRGGYPPEQGGYPPQQGYPPPRQDQGGGYGQDQRGGYPDQGGYGQGQGGGYPGGQGGYGQGQGGGYPDQGGYGQGQGGGYPDQGGYGQGQGGGYPDQGGYGQGQGGGYPGGQGGHPDQGGYQQSYDQRPAAASGPSGPSAYGSQGGGYPEQGGYREGGDYGQPQAQPGGQQGYGGYPDQGGYGREPARPEAGGYSAPAPQEQRPSYGEPGGGYDQGYQQGGGGYGQQGQQDYGQDQYTQYAESASGYGAPSGYAEPAGGGYGEPAGGGYGEPARSEYDYGQSGGDYGQAGGYGGYGQGGYGSAGAAVTLQLDDGSGRTYQLRDGSNIVGRGQDAQFRLPDTGVSRRHLEIRWDGQVALLSDLNSTNGTTVNNAPVQEWQLADGDVVRLGHSEIIVRIH